MVKNLPAKAGDTGDMALIAGLGMCPGEGNSNLLQYPRLENRMKRGAWQAAVHGVTKGRTRLSLRTVDPYRTCLLLFQLVTGRILNSLLTILQ